MRGSSAQCRRSVSDDEGGHHGVPLTLWGFLPLSLSGQEAVGTFSRYTIAPIVAFGYLGLLLVLLRWRGGTGFVARNFASVGRTALS